MGNRVVVLDEIHAYDAYSSGLIECLLQWLKALGSSVMLMSTTLPRAKHDALLHDWGVEPQEVLSSTHPRLTLANDKGVHGQSFAARPLLDTHLQGVGEDPESIAANGRGQGTCALE